MCWITWKQTACFQQKWQRASKNSNVSLSKFHHRHWLFYREQSLTYGNEKWSGNWLFEFTLNSLSEFVLFTRFQAKILLLSKTDTNEITLPKERHFVDLNPIHLAKFNEYSKHLFTAATANHVKVVDFESKKVIHKLHDYKNIVQSFSWNSSESQIVTNTKNMTIQMTDVRAQRAEISAPSHQCIRDARVVWLSNENYIISTGMFLCHHHATFISIIFFVPFRIR